MSTSPHCLYCDVCDGNFDGRETWLNHLLQGSHQNLARIKTVEWGREERECAIVVFSTCSMENGESLLEHFSKDVGTIVTDFVWWSERPKVGLMQFESCHKVDEVLSRLGRPELQLTDCFVQLKKALDYLELEWNELIVRRSVIGSIEDFRDGPICAHDSTVILKPEPDVTETIQPTHSPSSPEQTQIVKRDELSETSRVDSGSREAEESRTDDASSKPMIIKRNLSNEESTAEVHSRKSRRKVEPLSKCENFLAQFREFCYRMEIPDEEFNEYLDVINKIRLIAGDEHEVVMYRNKYLKLRNPGNDMFLLLMYKKENHKEPNKFLNADHSWDQNLLNHGASSKEILSGFKLQFTLPSLRGRFAGSLYTHAETKFHFALATYPFLIVEAQMNRLLAYLCTFDPRVKALFCMIFGWANAHHLNFAEKSISRNYHHSNVPDPAALEWLVILFLCKSGILPTPREIQERPHKPLVFGEHGGDIGFSDDPEFVEEWKSICPNVWKHPPEEKHKEFVLSVLKLMKDMFTFYSNNLEVGEWILNTRDGEIYDRDVFMAAEPGIVWKTKLTENEVWMIRNQGIKNDSLPHLRIYDWRIYVLHPIFLLWRLSLDDSMFSKATLGLMKTTAKRLSQIFKSKDEDLNEISLNSVVFGRSGLKKKIEYMDRQPNKTFIDRYHLEMKGSRVVSKKKDKAS